MIQPRWYLGYKTLPYWLKGGIGIGVLTSVIYVLVLWINILFGEGTIREGWIFEGLIGQPYWIVSLVTFISVYVAFACGFVIGAIVGFIYGRIKQSGNKKL